MTLMKIGLYAGCFVLLILLNLMYFKMAKDLMDQTFDLKKKGVKTNDFQEAGLISLVSVNSEMKTNNSLETIDEKFISNLDSNAVVFKSHKKKHHHKGIEIDNLLIRL